MKQDTQTIKILRNPHRFLVVMLVFIAFVQFPNVQARILAEDEAQQAETTALETEAKLFQTIRMGIALSLARCEGQPSCVPSVNAEEVKRLLDTLNTRIEDLTLRQESVEDPTAFDAVMAMYEGERDNYSGFLDKLPTVEDEIEEIGIEEEVVEFEEPSLDEVMTEEAEVISEEATEAVVEQPADLEIFEDVDESLEDDEDLEGFEDDFDPDQF